MGLLELELIVRGSQRFFVVVVARVLVFTLAASVVGDTAVSCRTAGLPDGLLGEVHFDI